MPLLFTLALLLSLLFLLWLFSLWLRDASIVDIFWGCGFVIIAWVCLLTTPERTPRALLVTILITVWGLRLALYLFRRNAGQGEDYRYAAMRKRIGRYFPFFSLFLVFGFQGVLIWLISFPLQQAITAVQPQSLTALDFAGALLWISGFLFEAVGDWQLTRFKANPANRGQVMDRGLWRYTRHPNYFGDALLWWGFFLIALATPNGWWTMLSPLVMTFLLIKVSGVALLERTLAGSRPQYADYRRRTSAFVPWFPKKN